MNLVSPATSDRLFVSRHPTMSQHSARASPSMPSRSRLPGKVHSPTAGASPSPPIAAAGRRSLLSLVLSSGPFPMGRHRGQRDPRSSSFDSQNRWYSAPPLRRTSTQLSNQGLSRAGPIESGGGRTTRSATMDFDPTSPPGGVLRHAYAYVREEYGLD